jgi:hypothetical protein
VHGDIDDAVNCPRRARGVVSQPLGQNFANEPAPSGSSDGQIDIYGMREKNSKEEGEGD